MSANLFGELFRVTTFGESHGPAIGLLIDGVQPNLPVDVQAIQAELDRRRPGQSSITTQRSEDDRVEIVSGVFEGKTTGTPICMLIRNKDQRSRDYGKLAEVLRPGHASYTYLQKFGIFDYRGGGRASGRETATRVAAGAVAKQFLAERDIHVSAYTHAIGDVVISEVDESVIEQNLVRAPDAAAAEAMVQAIEQARDAGDSLGGVIAIRVAGMPVGLGEPVFHKLEAEMAGALLSIGAVKAFEIGSGVRAAVTSGAEHNDSWYFDEVLGRPRTRSNNAGGTLGGISNGEDLEMRIAVKAPSSIRKQQKTIDRQGNAVELSTGGRHDPCICPRVVPVAEAMVALVLIDLILLQERISAQAVASSANSAAAAENLRKIESIDTQLAMLLAQRRSLKTAAGQLSRPDEVASSEKLAKIAELLELSDVELTALQMIRRQPIQSDSADPGSQKAKDEWADLATKVNTGLNPEMKKREDGGQ